MNRQCLVPSLFAVLFLALMPGCSEDSHPGGARLHAPVREHDFGGVFGGAVREAHFELANQGTEDLVILRTLEDCGCTKPRFSSDRIPPGGRAIMTVIFKAPIFNGGLNKRVRVFTNDPEEGEAVFRLKMTCMGKAHVSPERIDLGRGTVMKKAERRERIELLLPEGQEVEDVKLVGDVPPFVSLELMEGKGHNRAALDLIFRGLREEMAYHDLLRLEVTSRDSRGKKAVTSPQGIQITGSLVPAVRPAPAMIALGTLRAGARVRIQVVLSSLDQVEIQDVSLTVSSGVRLLQRSLQGARLEAVLECSTRPGRLFCVLCLRTGGGQLVEVPVTGWLEGEGR